MEKNYPFQIFMLEINSNYSQLIVINNLRRPSADQMIRHACIQLDLMIRHLDQMIRHTQICME